VSFYRPSGTRTALLIEKSAFPRTVMPPNPSAVPRPRTVTGLIEIAPRPGEHVLRTRTFFALIDHEGARIATTCCGSAIPDWAGPRRRGHHRRRRRAGCTVGWDLAHALQRRSGPPCGRPRFRGVVPLQVLNGGPGAVGGAFITSVTRSAGLPASPLVGHDKATRFQMDRNSGRFPAQRAGN